VLFKK